MEIIKAILRRLRMIYCIAVCSWRYRRRWHALTKISKTRRVRVLFLVSSTAKWKCQTFFDELKRSELFEPFMALMTANDDNLSSEELEVKQSRDRRFYEGYGNACVVAMAPSPREYRDLRTFSPDIVVYQQPWGLPPIYEPLTVSRFALTAYVPYYLPDSSFDPKIDAGLLFHRLLWLFVVPNVYWEKVYRRAQETFSSADNVRSWGHPMLDQYRSFSDDDGVGRSVIYAPHFSFRYPGHKTALSISTFSENGLAILEYAKAHPEIKWVFRPHPVLRSHLISSGMWTAEKTDWYYSEWERIGTCSYEGSYVGLFKDSRALITDCGSFLTEYAATGRPVIHLISDQTGEDVVYPYDEVISTFYKVRDLNQMYAAFACVIEKGLDPEKERRIVAVKRAGLMESASAKLITDNLSRMLSKGRIYG